MAFMGIVFVALFFFIAIIGGSTLLAVVLIVVSLKKGNEQYRLQMFYQMQGIVYKPKRSYIAMRVIGCIFLLPLIGMGFLIAYSTISTKIETYNSLAYNVNNGNYERAEEILKSGVSPDCTVESNEPAKDGEQTLLSTMCKNSGFSDGYDYSSRKDYKETDEELAMMQLLIDYGADIEAVSYTHPIKYKNHYYTEYYDYYKSSDECGYTPLLYAVRNGNSKIVKLLVENGADVNVCDYCGYNAVATVADNLSDQQGLEILQYLIEKGVSTTRITHFHQTADFLVDRHTTTDNEEIAHILGQND